MASFAFLWGQPNAVLVFLAFTILLLLILDNYFVNILFFGFFGLRVWLIFVAVLVIGMRLIFVRVVKCKDFSPRTASSTDVPRGSASAVWTRAAPAATRADAGRR